MKVIEGLPVGTEAGRQLSVAELGLPVTGKGGLLIVFWKTR